MIRLRFVAVLAAVAALALPAAANAGPDPTRVSFASHASYVSPQQLNLEVRVSCSTGLSYGVGASVLQQQGPFVQTYGDGFASGVCTGQTQKVAVSIFSFSYPGWQLGDAVASVYACAFTCDSSSREIRIAL